MNQTSSASSSSFITLKRTRPEDRSSPFPPLPKINSELILQVYTHISLRRLDAPPDDYGDNERLARLGEMVLDATVTYALFNKRPMLNTQEIRLYRHKAVSAENLEKWVAMYGMKQKLRCHPDVFSNLDTPQESRTLFHAYLGGVYMEQGIETVQEWIGQLILGEGQQIFPSPVSPLTTDAPPPKKAKGESPAPHALPTIFFGSQPPPSPPRQTPPPPPPLSPPPAPLPNPLAPAQPSLPFLPLFNQSAAQRHVTVEYQAEFNGPPHAGRWSIKCVVNGIPKGLGVGSSKQVAKEEAARQAYYAMGWT